jgi:hypothetical protein
VKNIVALGVSLPSSGSVDSSRLCLSALGMTILWVGNDRPCLPWTVAVRPNDDHATGVN